MFDEKTINFTIILYLAFFMGSQEVFSALQDCWQIDNILGVSEAQSGILISINTFEFYILFIIFGHAMDRFKTVDLFMSGVILKLIYITMSQIQTEQWTFILFYFTINATYKMILNFSWFVLIKRQVCFKESRLKFFMSILIQDLGIIFIGALQDYTHKHHNVTTHSLKRQHINSAFRTSFQTMFIVTLIALWFCYVLKQRREIGEINNEEQYKKEYLRKQDDMSHEMTQYDIVEDHKAYKSNISNINETIQRLDPTNYQSEALAILKREDFNKILFVYIISGISIVFKRNFQRFFQYFSKQIQPDLNFMQLSMLGTCGFMLYIQIDSQFNFRENSKSKLIITILIFMLIQQTGFFQMVLFPNNINSVYVLTLIVFVSTGVIFSTQKRHQMQLSSHNRELLVYSLMVVPSLSYKSFEAMLVSEIIINQFNRPSVIWLTFIGITCLPIIMIVFQFNWLTAEDEDDGLVEKEVEIGGILKNDIKIKKV